MAGGYPASLDVCNGNQYGFTSASSTGAQITTGAANTKGSWVQLTSSTSSDSSLLYICANYYADSSANDQAAFDIGIGGSGSEQVIVSNFLIDGATGGSTLGGGGVVIPMSIPSGTRIAARAQSSKTGGSDNDLWIGVIAFDSGFSNMEGASGVDAIGFNSATTLGTAVVCSTNNTKGSYSQITSSTSRDYIGLFAAMDLQHSVINPGNWAWDIAVGGSGSEKIIIPNFTHWGGSSTGFAPCIMNFVPVNIPAGTRLAARLACKTANTPGITLYGVYQ